MFSLKRLQHPFRGELTCLVFFKDKTQEKDVPLPNFMRFILYILPLIISRWQKTVYKPSEFTENKIMALLDENVGMVGQ